MPNNGKFLYCLGSNNKYVNNYDCNYQKRLLYCILFCRDRYD